ncbi:MAG: nucleotidyltransferase domain-containing protein [Candidatus Woesearchaeota archaeon]|jgi:predicted nucleotidyltransferase/uncharacterized protein (UPF0332 family)|nr:nucleotidyltransferase domain-containing protein [Candidatus Woesearchaeota archaeon]|tara:strand:+ start:921 stop:1721 length:801 start_codon:yes stop_codon:yes gene_type:complete
MEFRIDKTINPNTDKYNKQDIDLAYEFSKKIYKEFGEFIKAIVLFGSTARRKVKTGDIDLLIVIDDITIKLTAEIVEAYRIITEKTIIKTSKKLHITTLKLTSFWEYMRAGDPIGINILRDGIALIDTGFFDPLQALLRSGRIRPSQESIWTYFSRAPSTLANSKWHLLQATLDLYWAIIDSSHAALMKLGEIPPSPSHVADLLEKKMVKKKLLEKKYVTTMRNFYRLSRMILHREIKDIKGEEFDRYYNDANDFVERIKKFIEKS